MKSRSSRLWENLRASFWFFPAMIALTGGLLLQLTFYLDSLAGNRWISGVSWMHAGSAVGAKQLLATIAGALISVIGIVFSMTMVTLTMASSQYGSRLLRNFMKDTKTQGALGIFVATFIYCILTLRNIRSAGEYAFVPHLTVTVALALTLLSVAILVFFIHHVSVRIQAPTVIAELSRELLGSLERLFPKTIGTEGKGAPAPGTGDGWEVQKRDSAKLIASRGGYLQAVDLEALMAVTREHDIIVEFFYRPGDFIIDGEEAGIVFPKERSSDAVTSAILKTLIVGDHRTTNQDVKFAFEQIVEVAERALSPGINAPLVALMCIDHLTLALCRVLERPKASPFRYDDEHHLRVIAHPVGFPDLFNLSFGQIAYYARTSPTVNVLLLEKAVILARRAKEAEDQDAIRRFAASLRQCRQEGSWSAEDKKNFDQHCETILR